MLLVVMLSLCPLFSFNGRFLTYNLNLFMPSKYLCVILKMSAFWIFSHVGVRKTARNISLLFVELAALSQHYTNISFENKIKTFHIARQQQRESKWVRKWRSEIFVAPLLLTHITTIFLTHLLERKITYFWWWRPNSTMPFFSDVIPQSL